MQQSKLFTKTLKNPPKDEKSLNAKLLEQAGFVQKLMAGVYSYLPLGDRVLRKIENIIREEMIKADGQEIYMPALAPVKNYKITERADLDILFNLKIKEKVEYVLNQSHEEIVVPLVKPYIESYRDLPIKVFQLQDKYRNEPRSKSGLLRGREFYMKDLYSFHANLEDLEKYYDQMKQVYLNTFKLLGFSDIMLVEASGGSFSKYSHEFQVPAEAGEDTVFYCTQCDFAQNKEISKVKKDDKCPKCSKGQIQITKAIEVGNIFKLKDRFTKAFDLTYKDKNGQEQPVMMGCYGLGPSRVMGTLVEISHDENGIIWPKSVAPYQVHLLSLQPNNEEVAKQAEKLYTTLQNNNVEVLYDDRQVSPGFKFKDSDLIGIPQRVIVSEKTLEKKSFELKSRLDDKTELIPLDQILSICD